MKTGIELIAIERKEQIEKHGFDNNHDKEFNKGTGSLKYAALYALIGKHKYYPHNWNEHFANKISIKSEKERVIVAAALLAAYIDELNSKEIQENSTSAV